MPTLIVENVPPEIYECLKQRADAKRRSVPDEALHLLRHVLAGDLSRKQAPPPPRNRLGYVLLIGMLLFIVLTGLFVLKGGGQRALPPRKPIEFTSGFFAEEQHQDQGWRWMSEEGVVVLQNTKQPMVLKIVGRVPKDRLPKPPTITIELNGQTLEQFEGLSIDQAKEYTISAAQQGAEEFSELRIRTNMISVPKEFDKNSKDGRKLGFKLHELTWKAQDEMPP